METVYLPSYQFEKLWDMLCSMQISQDQSVGKLIVHRNKEYVATGGSSYKGRSNYRGYRVVDLHSYKGDLKPLPYVQHNNEVDAGRRDRGYKGMQIRSASRHLVCVEEVRFELGDAQQQLSMF